MSAPHYDGVKALLVAESTLTGKVVDSVLEDEDGLVRDVYVILYGGGPDEIDDERFTAPQVIASKAEYSYTVRSVATTADGARATNDKVMSALTGKTPTVTGRRCDPLRFVTSDQVKSDDEAKPPLFFLDTDFTLVSNRA